MLCIYVEMNMEGELRKLGKTQNCILGGGDCWSLSITSYHLVSHLGWQSLPEIIKTAIITYRVNRRFSFHMVQLVFQMVQFGVFQMVQFPDGSAGCVSDGSVGCVPDGLVWCVPDCSVSKWLRLMCSHSSVWCVPDSLVCCWWFSLMCSRSYLG